MNDAATQRYRVPAPAAAELIDWPSDFGTRFLVFSDVEEEFEWTVPVDRRNRSTAAMAAFPAAHRRFRDQGIGLVCMVDHPVATDPAAADILRRVLEDGRSTIGAQLHAWVTPPYPPEFPSDSYPGNLPRRWEAAKIDTLTDALVAAFGRRPLAYRAGRYGIGPATIELLASRGYRVDSSVRARYDYRRDGGPDFTAVGAAAYRVGKLVELPLTTVFTGRARAAGPILYPWLSKLPRARGAFARAGLLQRVALTPEDMPVEAALGAIDIAVGEGTRLLSLSFHSPTLAPGNTPYVRDAADLAAFWHWWDRVLARLDGLGVMPTTLDDAIAAAEKAEVGRR